MCICALGFGDLATPTALSLTLYKNDIGKSTHGRFSEKFWLYQSIFFF